MRNKKVDHGEARIDVAYYRAAQHRNVCHDCTASINQSVYVSVPGGFRV